MELLIVIGVIAVLVSLLLPAMARARESAAQLTCSSNLRQWASLAMLYANQERGYLPRRGQGAQPTTVIDRPTDWFNALPALLKIKPYSQRAAEGSIPRPGENSIWICPSAIDTGGANFFAYGMNMRLSTWNAPLPDRINHIGSWSTVVLMSDAPGAYCSVLPATSGYSPVARHRGRINIAFLDGHVASYTGKEVGCGVGDPKRPDIRWIVPFSNWAGPGGSGS